MCDNGSMVYWRVRNSQPGTGWRFGYVTRLNNGLVRMGLWNGDTEGGAVVSESEIETKPYN